jgi:hypothetical protein
LSYKTTTSSTNSRNSTSSASCATTTASRHNVYTTSLDCRTTTSATGHIVAGDVVSITTTSVSPGRSITTATDDNIESFARRHSKTSIDISTVTTIHITSTTMRRPACTNQRD